LFITEVCRGKAGAIGAGLLALLLLSACANRVPPPPLYRPPPGPLATVVMRGEVKPGETFGFFVFQDGQNCKQPEELGVGRSGVDPATVSIGARLVTVEMFMLLQDRKSCRLVWSFEPAAGRKYLMVASSTLSGCRGNVLDATDPDNPIAERSLRRRDDGTTRQCIPLAKTHTRAELATDARARIDDDVDLPIPSDDRAKRAPSGAATTPTPVRPAPQPSRGSAPVTEDDLSGLKGPSR
jgi:hypothetical protein